MKRILASVLSLVIALCLCGAALAKTESGLVIEVPSDSIFVDETLQISVKDTSGTLDLTGILYSVSNNNAEISEDGLLTPKRSGSVTVTARTADKKHRATLRVNLLLRPESITIKGGKDTLAVGKKISLSTSMKPSGVKDRSVTWTTSDASIAEITEKGKVTAMAPGNVTFTATSVLYPEVKATFDMQVVRLASSITFAEVEPSVIVGEQLPLNVIFEPDDTSLRVLKFTSNRNKLASVDENGVVTGVKAGKATIKAKTTDGSSKSATVIVHVVQPVLGMSFKRQEVRIGVGGYATITAELQPKDATNKAMIWKSADESIATIKGDTNKVRVYAHAWGDTTITGTTVDGNFSATMTVHGGSYSRAIRIRESRVKTNGRISLVFENVSNLDIAEVRFHMRIMNVPDPGMIGMAQPIEIDGKYRHELEPGDRTVHGQFSFKHPSLDSHYKCETAITGFTTTDGFRFNIGESHWKYVSTDKK